MRHTIFVVDDEQQIRRLFDHWLRLKCGYRVRTFASGEDCLDALDEAPDLIVLDVMLNGISGIETLRKIRLRAPEVQVIMVSGQGQTDVVVEAIKLGAIDYLPKTTELPKLELAIRNALQISDLSRQVDELRAEAGHREGPEGIIASVGSMDEALRLVSKAQNSDISVLVQGESGTGKELIARAIHFGGRRAAGPFVVVNCAAIPHELLESEMFGHEKGSFTGAVARKIGKFEQAHGGTLFLDEVGELEPNLQAKLLRAIQQRQFERVGGNETLSADVRIVSATHRDLLQEAARGSFREDLYYRLASFPIALPPLRQRRPDIFLLAGHFLERFTAREGKEVKAFTHEARKLLYEYPWPGNVRELESAVERAVLLCEGEVIGIEDLPAAVRIFDRGEERMPEETPFFDPKMPVMTIDVLKELAVRHALQVTGGNVVESARRLGISRSSIYDLIRRYAVPLREPIAFG
jgi:DNA-binding NtrC family response regulator